MTRCPKCGGNLFLTKDLDSGWIEICIQCGRRRYFDELVPAKVPAGAGKD